MSASSLLAWTNVAGLVFGMVGVLMIFVWVPPQPSFETGVPIGLEDGNVLSHGRTVREHNDEIKAKRRRHFWVSRLGLGLIFLGFFLQMVGSWPSKVGP